MSKMARTKGQNGEREIVKILQPIVEKYYPEEEVGRNLEQTRSGGHDIAGVPGFAVEVKRHENLNVKAWWKQTIEQAVRAQCRPVLLYRPNRKPWRAVISMYEMMPTVVSTDYSMTLDMSLEAFLIWFDDRMKADSIVASLIEDPL